MTDSPSSRASQEALNRALTVKAETETALLGRQLAPGHQRLERLKSLAGLSGALLAAIALISALGSLVSWLGDREQARQTQAEERLQRGLTLLAGDTPSARMAGLSAMRSFASAEDPRAQQMFVSVANALAVEPDPRVRAAIVAFFDNLRSEAIPAEALNPALRALVGTNRLAAMRTGSWYVNPLTSASRPELQEGGELDAQGKAIAALLRSGARGDLSGTYLRNVNLAGLDLGATNFRGADLAGSSLHRSSLPRSDFRGARLSRTDLSFAKLQGSSFASPEPGREDFPRRSYVFSDLRRSGSPATLPIGMPSFRCADLTGADFRNAFIFIDVGIGYADSRFHDFQGAEVAGADFGRPWLWRVGRAGGSDPSRGKDAVWGGWTFSLPGGWELQGYTVKDDLVLTGEIKDVQFGELTGFDGMSLTARLDAARWQRAKLPRWALQLLKDATASSMPECGR